MKKNYKIAKPPQRFMELPQIYATYGSRPIIAYNCKVPKETPIGGYIIAVQNEPDEPNDGIKAYMKQLKERFSAKEPIYYIRVREDIIIYDKGQGEVKALPDIQEKKPSKIQLAVEGIPDETLAKAISSAFK